MSSFLLIFYSGSPSRVIRCTSLCAWHRIMSDLYFQSHQLQVMQFTSALCMCLDPHVHDDHFSRLNTSKHTKTPQVWSATMLHSSMNTALPHVPRSDRESKNTKLLACHVRSRSTAYYTNINMNSLLICMYYGQFFLLVPGHPGNRTVYAPGLKHYRPSHK